jgi:hypothetical protein
MEWLEFNRKAFDWFANDAGDYYERLAPQVVTWLDQIIERLDDGSITLTELRRVAILRMDGVWLDPHGAGNLAYKAMSEFGKLPSNVTISY